MSSVVVVELLILLSFKLALFFSELNFVPFYLDEPDIPISNFSNLPFGSNCYSNSSLKQSAPNVSVSHLFVPADQHTSNPSQAKLFRILSELKTLCFVNRLKHQMTHKKRKLLQ